MLRSLCAAPECDIIYDVRETHLTNRWKKCLLSPFVSPAWWLTARILWTLKFEKNPSATSFSFLRLYELVSDKGLRPHIKFFWRINAIVKPIYFAHPPLLMDKNEKGHLDKMSIKLLMWKIRNKISHKSLTSPPSWELLWPELRSN